MYIPQSYLLKCEDQPLRHTCIEPLTVKHNLPDYVTLNNIRIKHVNESSMFESFTSIKCIGV